LLTNY